MFRGVQTPLLVPGRYAKLYLVGAVRGREWQNIVPRILAMVKLQFTHGRVNKGENELCLDSYSELSQLTQRAKARRLESTSLVH